MTRYEILAFLGSGEATAEDIAGHFSIPRSYVYSRLTVLNRQGLLTKRKGEDGILRFGLTKWGQGKLGWLAEQGEGNFEENKSSGGDKKMATRRKYLEDGLYVCPSCEDEYELEDVLEGGPESLCPTCGEELEMVDEDGGLDEDEEEIVEPVRQRR